MIPLLPPLMLFVTGLTLLLFGSIQSVFQLPNPNIWQTVFYTMPELIAVLLFLLCLLASAMGLILMVHGYRHTRRRFQFHHHRYEDMYPIEHP